MPNLGIIIHWDCRSIPVMVDSYEGIMANKASLAPVRWVSKRERGTRNLTRSRLPARSFAAPRRTLNSRAGTSKS